MKQRSELRNWCSVLLSGALILGLSGCNDVDEIRQYRVPALADADDLPPPPSLGASASSRENPHAHLHEHDLGPRRMVVTIVEEAGRHWFFRMLGPSADIDKEIRHFISFMHSLEFTGGANSTPQFEYPSHWEPLPATGMRFAAFRFGNEADPIELTVVPLGPEAGDLLANVNRWREQLQLPPITEAQLPESATPVTLGDREITLVDLVSSQHHAAIPGGVASELDPHSTPHADPHAFSNNVPSITYDVPTGWSERDATGMRQASLAVASDNEDIIEISVIALPGEAGGVLANVNFWREQLGLGEIGESQLSEILWSLTIDGDKQALAVDLAEDGPFNDREADASASSSQLPRQRIIAAIHSHDEHTWFIKMSGLDETVGEHKERFKAFVASIRLGEDNVQ